MSNFKIDGKLTSSSIGDELIKAITDAIFPIGAYYITEITNFNPNNLFYGIWEQLSGGYALLTTDANNSNSSTTSASNHIPGNSYSGGLPNITGKLTRFLTYPSGSREGALSESYWGSTNKDATVTQVWGGENSKICWDTCDTN